MKKDYKVYVYNNYIKRIIYLCIVCWILPVVYILTKEKSENFQWGYIMFSVILMIVLIIIMCFARKIFLGILLAYEVDLHKLYEIDKRNAKHEDYNLKLLMNLYFYDGEFQKSIECSDKLLQLCKKPNGVYRVMHQKILSLFLQQETADILTLTEQQRQIALKHKLKLTNETLYYNFIQDYLSGEYEKAIQSMQKVLEEKNIEVLNHIKIMANYFMLLAYERLEDREQVKNCAKEILCADKNRRTFFSNNLTTILDIDKLLSS